MKFVSNMQSDKHTRQVPTHLVFEQQIGLLLELLQLLGLLELLAGLGFGHLFDGPCVESPKLLLDCLGRLLCDWLVRLAMLALIVEKPVGQPITIPKGVLVVPFVDDVVCRLLTTCQLVSKSHGLGSDDVDSCKQC